MSQLVALKNRAAGGMTDWARPDAWHPAATIFPLMANTELDSLAKHIAEHGLLNPLVVHGGRLLDGRNRAIACAGAGAPSWVMGWRR